MAMFYLVNGYNLPVEAGEVIGLTTDARSDQIGVQDIAAILKDWAQPFPDDHDWMASRRERLRD
jgi:death on curing protein